MHEECGERDAKGVDDIVRVSSRVNVGDQNS